MPTILQLPISNAVTAADIVPLSQNGSTCGVSVGTLLAGVQPAIQADPHSLLGRISVGSGGPEQINVGVGLSIAAGSLAADGTDHASFPQQQSFSATDAVVMSSAGKPALLPVGALRSLFAAGANVAISASGIISSSGGTSSGDFAPGGTQIGALPVVSSVSARDVVAISQNGTDAAVGIGNLLDGLTIDAAHAAGPASDSDSLWVGQSSNVMARQTFAAIWSWLAIKLPGYKSPVVEVTSDTTLDSVAHNGRILVCSGSAVLSPPAAGLGSGFQCDVINVSPSGVVLGNGITSSSGQSILAAGQAMRLYAVSYSGGSFIYAWIAAESTPAFLPGRVTDLSAVSSSANSVVLSWSAPASGGVILSYTVSYRVSGVATWSVGGTGVISTQYTVAALTPGSNYDFMVIAVDSSLNSTASNITTAMTSFTTEPISAPTGLTGTNVTPSSITLRWAAPSSGNAQSYTVQYRMTGTTPWSGQVAGLVGLDYTATVLVSNQSYDWQVTAVSSAASTATSSIIAISTGPESASVQSIAWNVVPNSTFVHGSGAMGVNAHVSPATAGVRFGFSNSTTVPPASWTGGTYVNTDLWGAYIPIPAVAGTWFVWAEGMDGSAVTVYSSGVTIT